MATLPCSDGNFPKQIADCDPSLVGSERLMMANDDLQSLRSDLESIQETLDKMYEAYALLAGRTDSKL